MLLRDALLGDLFGQQTLYSAESVPSFTLPCLRANCVGQTCKRQALVQGALRGVDEGDGHLGFLYGHDSYAQSLRERKSTSGTW